MEFLCILGIGLVVLSIIGHALWLLLAGILKALFPAEPSQIPPIKGERGKQRRGSGNLLEKEELRIVAKTLARWKREELIDENQFKSLLDLLRAQQQKLNQPAPPANPFWESRPQATHTLHGKPAPEAPEKAPQKAPQQPPEKLPSKPLAPVPALSEPTSEPVAAQPPATPSRSWSDWLQGFMEEKNIRVGEIISGLLIIGSAIGLVVSLWSTLTQQLRYFPALVFLGTTLAIHGAGLYTLKRWNLKSTSYGLLAISIFLVPLNFLAGTALSKAQTIWDPFYLLAVSIGTIAGTFIVHSAGKHLLPQQGKWLLLTVMISSLGQLPIARLVDAGLSSWMSFALLAVPAICFLLASMKSLSLNTRETSWDQPRAERFLLFLGSSAFAIFCLIAFLILKIESFRACLPAVSSLLNLVFTSSLISGLLLQQRCLEPAIRTWKILGTSLAVLSGFLLVGIGVAAWPRPELLIGLALFDAILLARLAVVGSLPQLNYATILLLAFASLVGWHRVTGTLAGDVSSCEFLSVLAMGRSAAFLTVYSLLWTLSRRWLTEHWRASIRWSLWTLGAFSVVIAIRAGFAPAGQDASLCSLVFLAWSAMVVLAGICQQEAGESWSGGLLLLGIGHLFFANPLFAEWLVNINLIPAHPELMAGLIFSTVATGLLVRQKFQKDRALSVAWQTWALSLLGMISLVLLSGRADSAAQLTGYLSWITVLGFTLTGLTRSPWLMVASQLFGAIALGSGVVAICETHPWWNTEIAGLRLWFCFSIAGAGWAILWWGIRQIGRRREHLDSLLRPQPVTVDQLILGGGLLGLLGSSITACAPAVSRALFTISSMPGISVLDLLPVLMLSAGILSMYLLLSAGRGTYQAVTLAGGILVCFLLHMTFFIPKWERLSSAIPDELTGPFVWVGMAVTAIAVLLQCWESSGLAIRQEVTQPQRTAGQPLWLFAGLLLLIGILWLSVSTLADAHWIPVLMPLTLSVCFLGFSGWLRLRLPVQLTTADSPSSEQLPTSEDGINKWTGWVLALVQILVFAPLCYFVLFPVLQIFTKGVPELLLLGTVTGNPPALIWLPVSIFLAGIAAVLLPVVKLFRAESLLAGSLGIITAAGLCLVFHAWTDGPVSRELFVQFFQATGIAGILAGGLWLFTARSAGRSLNLEKLVPRASINGLSFQALMSITGLCAIALPTLSQFVILVTPYGLGDWLSEIGSLWGASALLGWLLLLFAWKTDTVSGRSFPGQFSLALFGLFLGTGFVAAAVHPREFVAGWTSFRAINIGWLLVCFVAILGPRIVSTLQKNHEFHSPAVLKVSRLWFLSLLVSLLICAVVELEEKLVPAVWPWVTLLSLIILTGLLTCWERRWRFSYLTLLLGWITLHLGISEGFPTFLGILRGASTAHLKRVDIMLLLQFGIYWAVINNSFQWMTRQGLALKQSRFPMPSVAAWVGIVLLAWWRFWELTGVTTHSLRWASFGLPLDYLTNGILLLELALLALLLWDRHAKFVLAGFSVWGLVAIGSVWYEVLPLSEKLWHVLSWSTAAYVAVCGGLWKARPAISQFASTLGIHPRHFDEEQILKWLPVQTLLLSCTVIGISFWTVLSSTLFPWREVASFPLLLLVPGIVLLAVKRWENLFQQFTILLELLFAVMLCWSFLDPTSAGWLQYVLWALVAAGTVTTLNGVLFLRMNWLPESWRTTIRESLPGLTGLSGIALAVTLTGEFLDRSQAAMLSTLEVGFVVLVLLGIATALISIAVLPHRLAKTLTETERHLRVYAAEVVLALICLHIYLVRPEWFGGIIMPYWAFIVMGLAFLSLGLSEFFSHRKMTVLSKPLQNTGAFLPLIPALGYWVTLSQLEPGFLWERYSFAMFLGGLIYVMLSYLRRSFSYGMTAALFGNVALWMLWISQGQAIFLQPQLWLIPPAISVLIAVHLHRHSLTDLQVASARYVCVTLIYVSSAGEMFMKGIGENFWLPVLLAMFSVCGILMGMLLRVRSFLYLGSGFLLVSLVSMVAHAARSIDEVWPWWAFGICLGILLLTMFGLFEKKRDELQQIMGKLQEWEK